MLIEMKSPAFKKQGVERPPIHFKKGLNVVLGKEDGAMSIGKSSALLAIDFVFGGNTYIRSDGVRKEGHHTIYFAFLFDGIKYLFARNTGNGNTVLNDSLFKTKRKPPHVHFNSYNSYVFETLDNTGTGSNYKGMLVYDLAVLFTTRLPAIAHDSLLFKNLGKDVEDGIIRIYTETKKQILISYDKQDDCRPVTKKILEDNCVLKLSTDNCELYGRSWDTEE